MNTFQKQMIKDVLVKPKAGAVPITGETSRYEGEASPNAAKYDVKKKLFGSSGSGKLFGE